MEDTFIEHITHTLIRHKDFIRKAKHNQTLHFAVVRLVRLIREHDILNGIIGEIEGHVRDVDSIKSSAAVLLAGKGAPDFNDELSFVLRSFYVLQSCASAGVGVEIEAAKPLCLEPFSHKENCEVFFTLHVEPLVTYLVDQLSNARYILSHLIRYKQRVEWFERQELQEHIRPINENDQIKRKSIEKVLNAHLYKYLHDKSVEFYIESSSVDSRGRVDLISAQGNNPQLLLDGKYLSQSNNIKQIIAEAFGQVYGYTQQYNRSSGYIVFFKNIEQELKFSFPNIVQGIDCMVLNNKRIYFLLIDIMIYDKPPSQMGKREIIELKETDLTSAFA